MASIRSLRPLFKLCTLSNATKIATRYVSQTYFNASTCLTSTKFSMQIPLTRAYSDESSSKLSQNQIEEKVMSILTNFDRIKENPSKPKVSLESHIIKELGLDSLDHVEIIVQLEDTFGYEIPDSEYEKLYTPKEIVNYILKRTNEA